MYIEVQKLQVSPHQTPMRLDVYIGQHLPNFTRSQGRKLIQEERVTVNGLPAKASRLVQPGDELEIALPRVIPPEVEPEQIDLDIVYEDDDLLVINKPPEMVVHPAKGHHNGTIVNALLYHLDHEGSLPPGSRPGIVHRLDKDTTGLLLLAKTDLVHRRLGVQFQKRLVHRTYHALVWGPVKDEQGTIDAPLGRSPRNRKVMTVLPDGKAAVTHWRLLEDFRFLALLELKLDTGRTHQIRVHLQHQGMPVLGDPDYGEDNRLHGFQPSVRKFVQPLLQGMERQCLHAKRLEFRHPVLNKDLSFEIDYPEDMSVIIQRLRERGAADSDDSL